MTNASTLGSMSPGLLRVVERAQREPEGRFHSLAHLIDVPALRRAYDRMRKDAAVGVDGMSKEQYGQDLEVRLEDLHVRLRSKRYRHQPIRRVHIPKAQGKTRPIGISAFEDKLVQDAVREERPRLLRGRAILLAIPACRRHGLLLRPSGSLRRPRFLRTGWQLPERDDLYRCHTLLS